MSYGSNGMFPSNDRRAVPPGLREPVKETGSCVPWSSQPTPSFDFVKLRGQSLKEENYMVTLSGSVPLLSIAHPW